MRAHKVLAAKINMKILILFALLSASAFGATVACVNNSSDVPNLNNALALGGTTTVTGAICSTAGGQIHWNNAVIMTTSVSTKIQGVNAGLIGVIASNNVTINGFVFDNGTLQFGGAQYYTNFVFTNNTMQNILSGGYPYCYQRADGSLVNGTQGNCVGVTALDGSGLRNSLIDHNQFLNLWGGGSTSTNPNTTNGSQYQTACGTGCWITNWGTVGISLHSLDQTTISYNTFDLTAMDGMHIDWSESTGNTNPYATSGNRIVFNTFTRQRRIPIELQSQPGGSGSCPGGCNFAPVTGVTDGLVVGGNYVHDYYYPGSDTWGSSLVPDGNTNGKFINNTYLANVNGGTPGAPTAACQETTTFGPSAMNSGIVCGSAGGGYGGGFAIGGGTSSHQPMPLQNIIMCGNGNMTGSINTNAFSYESTSNPTAIIQYNYQTSGSCPAGGTLPTSAMTPAFVSSSTTSGVQTFIFSMISNLSIRYGVFTVDGGPPIKTQEQVDTNTNFGSDRKWLYSVPVTLASYSTASHTLLLSFTDVSGAPSTVSTTFNGTMAGSCTITNATLPNGTVSIPYSAQINLASCGAGTYSVTAGTLPLGVSLNTGTGALTGTPSTAASNTFSIGFTGATPVSYTVVMAAASVCANNLVNDCDFAAGVGPWTFSAGGSTSTFAVDATGPLGVNAAHLTGAGTFTGGPELVQTGISVGPVNTVYRFSIQIRATRAQSVRILLQNSTNFENYGLDLTQPITTTFTTYTQVIQVIKASGNPAPGDAALAIQLPQFQAGDQIFISLSSILTSCGTITPNPIPGGTVGVSYTQFMGHTGTCTSPWSVPVGSLPSGLSLNPSSGAITGTPTAAGPTSFTLAIGDSSAPFTITIATSGGTPTVVPLQAPVVTLLGTVFQPAIVNGADQVSTNSIRYQYTTTGIINATRIVYATHSQWLANGNQVVNGTAGVNYSIFQTINGTGSIAAGSILGNVVTNLADNVFYHISGQVSVDNGATWSAPVETTFTTLLWTGVQLPNPPATFDLTTPTVTGTDRTVGVTVGCTGGSLAIAFQNCINVSVAGDGIGIVPGTPINLTIPGTNQPGLSINKFPTGAITSTVSGNTFTAASHGLTAAQQIRIYSTFSIPSPINPGVTYTVINPTTNTFQVTQDGLTTLPLLDAGAGTIFVLPWPHTQNYIKIHTTASATDLPPNNVKLSPAEYASSLGTIQVTTPGAAGVLQFGATAFWWLEGIRLSVLPSATSATETDPQPTNILWSTSAMSDHIVCSHCWLNGPVAPDRLLLTAQWEGTDQAVINSAIDGAALWHPTDMLPAATVGSNTATINGGNYHTVSSTNTKVTQVIPTTALTFSGSAGNFYVSASRTTGALTVTAATGMTVTGSGITLVNASTPDFPRDTNSACVSFIGAGCYTALNVASGTWNGSTITAWDNQNAFNIFGMRSNWTAEGNLGFQLKNDSPGPKIFKNNTYLGAGVTVGPYMDENFSNAACPQSTLCPYLHNAIDLTVNRNTLMVDPKYLFADPSWNGSWGYGRNALELKQGSSVEIDGNMLGPMQAGIAGANCMLFTSYTDYSFLTIINTQSGSDYSVTNNICQTTGAGILTSMGSINMVIPPQPTYRHQYLNNLFNNVSQYAVQNTPCCSGQTPLGDIIEIAGLQDVSINHNTGGTNQAGTINPAATSLVVALTGSLRVINNIFPYLTTSNRSGFAFSSSGSGNIPTPYPADGTQGSTLLSVVMRSSLLRNVFVCTYSNSAPDSLVDITSGVCGSSSAGYPASNPFPAGSTTAARVAAVKMYAPFVYGQTTAANGNAVNPRLTPQSPYVSGGATPGTDGADIGVNMSLLNAAQGTVSNVVGLPGSTNTTGIATWTYVGYGYKGDLTDTCTSVDWETEAQFIADNGVMLPTHYTRVANASTGPGQSVSLTGLSAHTNYKIRPNCPRYQPIGSLRTKD